MLNKYEKINKEDSRKILENIENFLSRYNLYKEFIFFQPKQPIDYNHNLSLCYNYLIFYLYDIAIQVEESTKKIIFKKSKLFLYY